MYNQCKKRERCCFLAAIHIDDSIVSFHSPSYSLCLSLALLPIRVCVGVWTVSEFGCATEADMQAGWGEINEKEDRVQQPVPASQVLRKDVGVSEAARPFCWVDGTGEFITSWPTTGPVAPWLLLIIPAIHPRGQRHAATDVQLIYCSRIMRIKKKFSVEKKEKNKKENFMSNSCRSPKSVTAILNGSGQTSSHLTRVRGAFDEVDSPSVSSCMHLVTGLNEPLRV